MCAGVRFADDRCNACFISSSSRGPDSFQNRGALIATEDVLPPWHGAIIIMATPLSKDGWRFSTQMRVEWRPNRFATGLNAFQFALGGGAGGGAGGAADQVPEDHTPRIKAGGLHAPFPLAG